MGIEIYINEKYVETLASTSEVNEKYSNDKTDLNLLIVGSEKTNNGEKLFFMTLEYYESYEPPKEDYEFISKVRTFNKREDNNVLNFKELPEDGVAFEQLIREMFLREGFEIHWTGVGPDQGRDLILIEKATGQFSSFKRKWLIECKHKAHSGKSLGIHELSSMTDACRAVGAEGFLLMCSTQPSSGLIQRLEETQQSTGIIFNYWDSIEIEKRLFQPDSFPLIHLFFPESSKDVGWKVYNANSPSLWPANYKDYFLYLSSRIAMNFPDLRDVENIIQVIEDAPKLPENQSLRPRAVHFDNKHEQFTVYVDYLVGKDADIILNPSDLDNYFQDGQGLYNDGQYSWYLTNWDIRLVYENRYSDRYHSEEKSYYDAYLEDFKVGSFRKEGLGDKLFLDKW